MDQYVFDAVIEEMDAYKPDVFDELYEQQQTHFLLPQQAFRLESLLNAQSALRPSAKGVQEKFLMAPVRVEKQVLWKKGIPDRPKRSFLEEEKQNLVDFYRLLDLVEDRAEKKEFKHLFLTLQELRRHHLSKYFLTLPDPINLRIFDYSDVIKRPLDLRTISNKLLRGKYKEVRQFQIDIVTMIQNCKVYFVADDEMFDVAVRFEDFFWKVYEDRKKYEEAEKTFKHYKKKCTPSKVGMKIQPRKQKRLGLFNEIQELPQHIRQKVHALMIRDIFPDRDHSKLNKIDILTLNDKNFEELKKIVRRESEKLPKRVKTEPKRQEKRRVNTSQTISDYDIYYSDQEEDVEAKIMNPATKIELGELLAGIDPGQYDSDDDD